MAWNLSLFLETELIATLDSTPEVERFSMPANAASGSSSEAAPADSSSNSPAIVAVTAESEEDKKEDNGLNHSQAKEDDKTEEQEKMQDQEDKGMTAPAAEEGTVHVILFELEPWVAAVPYWVDNQACHYNISVRILELVGSMWMCKMSRIV